MLDIGLLTLPLLSLLAVFGFAVITDVNMIAFDVKSVPKMAIDMGFDAGNVRDTIMYKIHNISDIAETSRGVTYSTIGDMRLQSLMTISQTLGIENGVVAVQGLLGLIPYRLKGKITQEGDTLNLIITGFSSDNSPLFISLKSNKLVFDSSYIINGQTGIPGAIGDTKLVIANADIEITSLLSRAAEAIVDHIDPYLLARYYFVLETPSATFTKTIPQLARCIEVLPKQQQIWPLLLWGRTYQFQKDYSKAVAIYSKIVDINPKFPFSYLRWGEALAKLGQYEESIAMYQKAIYNSRYYPNYPVAHSAAYSLWADSLVALGQIDAAEQVLRTGISAFYFGNEHSSANALSHYALGKFLMKYRRDYVDAEHNLRQAVYADNDPKYYAALQDVIAKQTPGYSDYLENARKVPASSKATANPVSDKHKPDKAMTVTVPILQSISNGPNGPHGSTGQYNHRN